MDHFAGLDVSVKATSVCIVDDTGKVVREVKVTSEPEALLAVLKNPAYHFKRIGLEAGPLSQWLFSALAEAELPVVCVETRHMQALLKAQINKTDRNDARGMAQMMVPSRLKAKRMVYSIPWCASSFGGGTQQARSAANMSRIEFEGMLVRSNDFAVFHLRSVLVVRDYGQT